MYYEEEGVIIEEYPCLEDYRKINMGKIVPLEVTHKNGQYIVGTYTLTGWDELNDVPIASLQYDDDLIKAALIRLNKRSSRIWKKLEAGMVPDVSEEYDCSVVKRWFSKRENREIRLQRDLELIRVAFVDHGNCRDDICIMTKLNERN